MRTRNKIQKVKVRNKRKNKGGGGEKDPKRQISKNKSI